MSFFFNMVQEGGVKGLGEWGLSHGVPWRGGGSARSLRSLAFIGYATRRNL